MERRVGNTRIEIVRGDITVEVVDAVVNAANSGLMGGGGVDGAIHAAGGPTILEACKVIVDRQGRLPTGQAVITSGGRLPARHVIHTVGPIYGRSGNDAALLASCHTESLHLAVENGLRSVAFPAISAGVYGYPLAEAAPVAFGAVRDFLRDDPPLDLVRFVLFSDRALAAFVAVAQELL